MKDKISELEMMVSRYKGMQKVFDREASRFPFRNKAWVQGEITDDVIAELEAILNMKGILD